MWASFCATKIDAQDLSIGWLHLAENLHELKLAIGLLTHEISSKSNSTKVQKIDFFCEYPKKSAPIFQGRNMIFTNFFLSGLKFLNYYT